jgi:sortase A
MQNRRPARMAGILLALAMAPAGGAAWLHWHAGEAAMPGPPEQVSVPAAEAPAQLQPLAGGLPTRIVAASAGIDALITEVGLVESGGELAWETAWRAAGHHLDSARPGQPGNMVITGHVSVADARNLAVFSSLDRLAPGDVVEVYSGDRVHRYRVERVAVVPPTEVRVLRSDFASRVTLLTCTPDLENRLVVTGTLI